VLIDGVLDDHRGVTEFAILYHPHRGARKHSHHHRPRLPILPRAPRPLFYDATCIVICPPSPGTLAAFQPPASIYCVLSDGLLIQLPAACRTRAGKARLSFVIDVKRLSLSPHIPGRRSVPRHNSCSVPDQFHSRAVYPASRVVRLSVAVSPHHAPAKAFVVVSVRTADCDLTRRVPRCMSFGSVAPFLAKPLRLQIPR
jgi:hypothetical protein